MGGGGAREDEAGGAAHGDEDDDEEEDGDTYPDENGADAADIAATNATSAARLGDALARLIEIESDTAEVRAVRLLDNLGFGELKHRALKDLSGGWRVRTMLAAAIFAKPDLLLLDEPTNHLSILAVMWLARELTESETWKDRVVVVVSHDRQFMDDVCSDIMHISGAARRLTQQRGNFSLWSQVRAEKKAEFAREVALRQAEIDKLREYAGHGFKYGGSSSQINKMKMKDKQAAKLEEAMVEHKLNLASLKEDLELPLKIASGGEIDGFVVRVKNVSFGYPLSGAREDDVSKEAGAEAATRGINGVRVGDGGADGDGGNGIDFLFTECDVALCLRLCARLVTSGRVVLNYSSV